MKHKFTREERRRGGLAVKDLQPPPRCSFNDTCQKTRFRNWHAYLGHLGLHAFAEKYCHGDLVEAARKFNLLGVAATDCFPANGAFAHAHQVVVEIQTKKGTTA